MINYFSLSMFRVIFALLLICFPVDGELLLIPAFFESEFFYEKARTFQLTSYNLISADLYF